MTREDRARTEEERREPSGGHPAPSPSELGLAPAYHQPETTEAPRPSAEGSATAPASDSPSPRAREEDEGARLLALLLDTDLFFSVKVTDTLKHIGYTTKTHRRLEGFAVALASENPTLALVNTGGHGVDWRSGIAAAVAASVPVIAFGSHVDLATQHEARDLGATSVIANSKLASDLPSVVARALRRTQQHKE